MEGVGLDVNGFNVGLSLDLLSLTADVSILSEGMIGACPSRVDVSWEKASYSAVLAKTGEVAEFNFAVALRQPFQRVIVFVEGAHRLISGACRVVFIFHVMWPSMETLVAKYIPHSGHRWALGTLIVYFDKLRG